jgi:hypothetical protein
MRPEADNQSNASRVRRSGYAARDAMQRLCGESSRRVAHVRFIRGDQPTGHCELNLFTSPSAEVSSSTSAWSACTSLDNRGPERERERERRPHEAVLTTPGRQRSPLHRSYWDGPERASIHLAKTRRENPRHKLWFVRLCDSTSGSLRNGRLPGPAAACRVLISPPDTRRAIRRDESLSKSSPPLTRGLFDSRSGSLRNGCLPRPPPA